MLISIFSLFSSYVRKGKCYNLIKQRELEAAEEDKFPMSPYDDISIKTLIAIGSIGEGKSSLCNSLAGKEYDDIEFPIDGTSTTSRHGNTGYGVFKGGIQN